MTNKEVKSEAIPPAVGEFEQFVVSNFETMPNHKVANVFLRILGRQIHRFDTLDQEHITKADLIEMIAEAVAHETNPKTTVDRLLKRREERIQQEESNQNE